jgi:hypothetical protein
LLSGLAAISSAYPPDLSIHLETIEASHEQEKPLIPPRKTRAEPDYREGRKRTQGQMVKKGRKTVIFLEACAKRADFMRQNAIPARIGAGFGYVILPNPKLIKEKRP